MSLPSLQFKWITFEYCGIGEAIELGETVPNLAQWYYVSTKVISKTKMLTRDFSNHRN